MNEKIGTQAEAWEFRRGVGGRAFPADYNWICPVCDVENRAFETTCYNCQVRAEQRDQPLVVGASSLTALADDPAVLNATAGAMIEAGVLDEDGPGFQPTDDARPFVDVESGGNDADEEEIAEIQVRYVDLKIKCGPVVVHDLTTDSPIARILRGEGGAAC